MHAASGFVASDFYSALATAVLFLHALFILWVIFGAFADALAPASPLAAYRFSCLGNPSELLPWPCPLTLLENWLEGRAGLEPYQGGFLLYYLDSLVYPDISAKVLTIAGVIVCVANLAFYARQVWISRHAHR